MSCGARELQVFVENASRNAIYTSQGAMVGYRSTWNMGRGVCFKKGFKSAMVDECTAIMAVEDLSVFCRWEEDGTLVECFLDIVPLKKADGGSIYLALVRCIKDKKIFSLAILLEWVDGAATFSGWCSSKTKETCSTCSICPLSLSPTISLRASCQ